MQIILHFFTFFLHFSAKIGAFLFIPPCSAHTYHKPQPPQNQPIRLHQDHTRTKLIISLGRRANRALLPRCVPRCARSRRAIRCETPCGTHSPVGVPHTHLTMQKTPEIAKKVTKSKKKCEKICTCQKKAVSLRRNLIKAVQIYDYIPKNSTCCSGWRNSRCIHYCSGIVPVLQRNAHNHQRKPILSSWRHLGAHPDKDHRDL